ncbi:MAG: hypothetical protein ABJX32_05195 [Tateyamaria sp.]|uniref:hypothetical protein n=1 Tax=Tateyamaria sp. TaxID=1929288 RepID=UPI00329A97E6
MNSNSVISSVLAVALTALIVLIGVHSIDVDYIPFNEVHHEALIEYFNMFDSRLQSFWYRVYVLILLPSALIAALIGPPSVGALDFFSRLDAVGEKLRKWCEKTVPFVTFCAPVLIVASFILIGCAYFGALDGNWVVETTLSVLFLLAAYVMIMAHVIHLRVFASVVVSVVALAALPVFDGTIIGFSRLELLAASDRHFTALIGSAFQLEAGLTWFDQHYPSYGMAIPLIVAALHKLGVGGTYLTLPYIASAFQALGLAGALWLSVRRSQTVFVNPVDQTRFALLCCFALVIIVGLGNLSPYSVAIFFPNQSFMRHLPVLFLIWSLLVLDRPSSNRNAFKVGLVVGACIIYTPEYGFVGAVSVFFAWLTQQRKERFSNHAAINLLFGLAGTASSLFIFYIAYWAGMGIPLTAFSSYIDFIRIFGSGFGGLELRFDARFIVILIHASLLFTKACIYLVRSQGTISAFDSGLALGTLIWLAYYVNRAHEWNLWSISLMYAFLVVPLLAKYWRKSAAVLLIALVFLEPSADNLKKALTRFVGEAQLKTEYVDCQNLARLRQQDCAKLTLLLDELVELKAQNNDVLWMTEFPLVTMLKLNEIPPTSFIDQFVPNVSKAREMQFSSQLQALAPSTIAIDTTADQAVREFYEIFIRNVGYSQCVSNITTWDIYRSQC